MDANILALILFGFLFAGFLGAVYFYIVDCIEERAFQNECAERHARYLASRR